jgi:hypothetical protein
MRLVFEKAIFTREFLDGYVKHSIYNPHLTELNELYQLQ